MKELFTNIISIQPGVIIAILLLIISRSVIKRRYVAKLRYWLWLVVALRLALPLDINIRLDRQAPVNIPVQEYYVAAQHSGRAEQQTDYEIITADQLESVYTQLPEDDTPVENMIVRTISLLDIVSQVWFSVALGLLWASFLSYWLAKRDVMQTAVFDKDLNRYMNNLMQEMGIDRPVRLAVCDYTGSPMLMGIFDPVIVLPRADYTQMQLSMILRHELTHYRRHDVAYKFLMHILACVYWFNPLVYLMGRYAGMDIEFSCDEDTVKHTDKQFKAEYARTIVKVITMQNNRFMLATTFSQNAQTVKERFTNIFLNRRLKRGRNILAGFMAVVLFATSMVGCSRAGRMNKTDNDYQNEAVSDNNIIIRDANTEYSFDESHIIYREVDNVQYSYFENDGYYFDYKMNDGAKYPKCFTSKIDANGNITPLCNRNICSHNDIDCNAYDGNDYCIYFTINGQLYGNSVFNAGVDRFIQMYKIDENGKTTFFKMDDTVISSNIITDNSYLYFTVEHWPGTGVDRTFGGRELIKVSLDDGRYEYLCAVPEEYAYDMTYTAISNGGEYIAFSKLRLDNHYVYDIGVINTETGEFEVLKSYNTFSGISLVNDTVKKYGDVFINEDKVYIADVRNNNLRCWQIGSNDEAILIDNLQEKLGAQASVRINNIIDDKVILTIATDTTQKYGRETYKFYDINTSVIGDLSLTGKDSGGFVKLIKICGEVGDNFVVITNHKTPIIAEYALISKENFFNNVPQIVSLGEFRT